MHYTHTCQIPLKFPALLSIGNTGSVLQSRYYLKERVLNKTFQKMPLPLNLNIKQVPSVSNHNFELRTGIFIFDNFTPMRLICSDFYPGNMLCAMKHLSLSLIFGYKMDGL